MAQDRHYDRQIHAAPAQAHFDGGQLVVHASQLGGCQRILVAGALGYEGKRPPKYQAQLFEAGHADEERKKRQLREWGLTIEAEQQQISLDLGGVKVVGALDGICSLAPDTSPEFLRQSRWDGSAAIAELKSMGDSAFRAWPRRRLGGHKQYAVQLSVYMHALDLPALYIVSRRTDKTTAPQDYDIVWVQDPPVSLPELQAIADALLESVQINDGMQGEETWPACPSHKPRWCQYDYLHDSARAVDGLEDRLGSFELDLDVQAEADDTEEIETRRTLREAKRLERAAVKRDMTINLHRDALARLVPTLPEHGTSIHIVSNATADFWQFCPHLLRLMGPAHLHASTWSMNRDNALELLDLLDQGQLLSATVLTGSYFKSREGAVYATLAEGLLARGQRLLAFWNHSKIMVVHNERAAIVIEGSANFTMNPRVEQYVVTHDRALQQFHVDWMEEMLQREARNAIGPAK